MFDEYENFICPGQKVTEVVYTSVECFRKQNFLKINRENFEN
jgi:hypothetical protein